MLKATMTTMFAIVIALTPVLADATTLVFSAATTAPVSNPGTAIGVVNPDLNILNTKMKRQSKQLKRRHKQLINRFNALETMVLDLQVALETPGGGGGNVMDQVTPEPNASIDVSCPGGKTFTISTGNDFSSGGCGIGYEGDNVTSGKCANLNEETGKQTNTAEVDCSLNGGEGACVGASGSGSCTAK